MTCEHCADQDDKCLYPYYGLAPHESFQSSVDRSQIVTRFLNRALWPSNFKEEGEDANCGVYTHCLECGDRYPG